MRDDDFILLSRSTYIKGVGSLNFIYTGFKNHNMLRLWN